MLSRKDIHQENIQGIELAYGAGRLFKKQISFQHHRVKLFPIIGGG